MAHPLDPTARGLMEELAGRGAAARLVTLSELRSAIWRHAISDDGAVKSVIGGLDLSGPFCVVNRIGNLMVPGGGCRRGMDGDYARAEFRALLVSWLSSLGSRVIDPPGGNSLVGADGDEWRERRAAAECGFVLHPVYAVSRPKLAPWPAETSAAGYGMGRYDQVAEALVVGETTIDCPDQVEQACRTLARRLRLDTLKLTLCRASGPWAFLGCERLPDLAGSALLALAGLAEARTA